MRIAVVKRRDTDRDRFYAMLDGGDETTWAATSAPGLPHDLQHLVVETVLGIERGFWGLVASGMLPSHVHGVTDHATRIGDGLADLLRAEWAVGHVLGLDDRPDLGIDDADAERIVDLATDLETRWNGLKNGRALETTWPYDPDQIVIP